jgi:hypothetical protein
MQSPIYHATAFVAVDSNRTTVSSGLAIKFFDQHLAHKEKEILTV